MAEWHHQCNGLELGQTPGDSEGQRAWCAAVHGVAKSQTQLGRRHYSGNCMGLTQMRCICVHPLGSLCCAICHIPTQGLFFHLNTGFCHVHQLQPFSFFSFAIPIAYSLLDITIIFVTLKNSIFLGPSSHWLIPFPSFITKFLEIVVCTLCHQFLFSKSLLNT